MTAPELFRALAVVCEGAGAEHQRVATALGLPAGASPADHTDAFVLQLPPYASMYLGAQGMLGGEAADRVAGFWRALGYVPPAEPDHLAALLGLYATLAEAEAAQQGPARSLAARARLALLGEHLLPWVPTYTAKMSSLRSCRYVAWSRMLSAALLTEAQAAGPSPFPGALREAAPPLEPHASLDELLTGLLAPIRSGMLLTRADLAGAAARLGLGLRQGERRFALRALLSQDPTATLRWLASEAEDWASRHEHLEPSLGEVARFWRSRAETSAALLHQGVGAMAGGEK